MTRARNLFQALIWIGMLTGLAIVLIGLFGSANQPQTASQPGQSAEPTAEAAATLSPQSHTAQPTLISPIATPTLEPRLAGILFESAGELYWQPVDEQGRAVAAVARAPIALPEKSRIGQLFPAPDGSQVMYFLETEGGPGSEGSWALYVFTPPDGQPRQVLTPADGIRPAKIFGWRPNSQQVIYGTDDGGIGLVDVDSGEHTLVAQVQKWTGMEYEPAIDGLAFSPDGQRLIISFTLSGQEWEVWIANADGSEPKSLFKMGGPVFEFAWSPNASYIAFVGMGLEVMSPDGQNRKTVSNSFSVGWAFKPRWSPDSHFIAFTAREEPQDKALRGTEQALFQGHKIYVVDIVTGEERRIVSNDVGGEVEPTWSPDGKRVIFLSNRSGAAEVWSASFDGRDLLPLTSDSRAKRWTPIWLTAPGR